jgi:hypothetical protein
MPVVFNHAHNVTVQSGNVSQLLAFARRFSWLPEALNGLGLIVHLLSGQSSSPAKNTGDKEILPLKRKLRQLTRRLPQQLWAGCVAVAIAIYSRNA